MYVLRAYDVGFNKCAHAHTCGSGATEDCDSWLPSESDAAFFEEGGGAQHSYIISKRKMKILLTSSIQHPRKTSRDGTSLGDETLGMRGIGGTTRTISGASSNKVKTEMCTSIVRGNSCAFGIKCKYAHEIDELSLRTRVERDEAGLIDLMTFRTRPCLDHVMTGSW